MTRKPLHRLLPVSALFLLLHAHGVLAQSEEEYLALAYGDRATVSIATGTKQQLRRAPAVASVITAEDIAAMGATDLDEVMETVPGVHVARNALANSPVFIMRGIFDANNPQILMLQNGVPTTTMFIGGKGNAWGGLPLENVARIEVIRGPGSALYGADAFSGVINIITKTAADTPGTQLGVRGGSFNMRSAWVQHGGQSGPVAVAAYLRVGSTDGFKETVAADAQTARDRTSGRAAASLAPGPINVGYDAVDASLDLSYDKWRLRGGYKLRDHVGTGAGISYSLDPNSYARNERTTVDLSWADPNISRDWGTGFSASYLQYVDTMPDNVLLAPPGVKFGATVFPNGQIGGPNKWERQLRLSAYATYGGFADQSIRFGVGHDDLNMYKTATYKNFFINQTTGLPTLPGPVIDYSNIQPFMSPQRRKVDYAYVQDEWRIDHDWTLTAGVRRDLYSDVGGTTNPRLALVWDANLDVTVKLLAGRAFRPPSFNELYGINNPVLRGNPALKPETNSTEEAAVSWQARSDLQLNVNVFRFTRRDMIVAAPNTPGAAQATFQNTGKQTGRGMELETIWDMNRTLRLTANYSYQKAIDETTHTDAGYAPHHHLYARCDWRLASGWLASAQANWVADRKRAYTAAAPDRRADIPDYTTADLTLRTTRSKDKWDFAASIRNLFNTRVLEPSLAPGTAIPGDLPGARRSFYLQAMHSL
jgi:iron complex outermembrane receptor protein